MIKTLNDFISIVALVIISAICVRFFVGSFFSKNKNNAKNTYTLKRKLLYDYTNNEEE